MIPQSRIETARKALDMITDRDFCYELMIYKDDDIFDHCEDSYILTLKKKQLLYLISQESGQDEVFEGLDMEETDLDDMLEEMSKVEFCYKSENNEDENEDCDDDDDDDDDDDGMEYTGYIQGIDEYIDNWVNMINRIAIGVVTDSNLDYWVNKIEDEIYL